MVVQTSAPCVGISMLGLLCLGAAFAVPAPITENRVTQKGSEPMNGERKWIGQRIATNGAVLRLLVPEASDSSNVPLDVILENRGEYRIRCGETGYFLECIVTLTSKDGKRISYSELGHATFGGRATAQYTVIGLKNSELRSWEINLAKAFEPLSDGQYVLTLEVSVQFQDSPTGEFTKHVKLTAKDIEIRIGKPAR